MTIVSCETIRRCQRIGRDAKAVPVGAIQTSFVLDGIALPVQ
jgi:hypothetical protein